MKADMQAMVLHKIGEPLNLVKRETSGAARRGIVIEVDACAVCRTDLHVVDGELTDARLPLIPGHEIVGKVIDIERVLSQRVWGNVSGFRGSDTHAGDAIIAGTGPRTFATSPFSPDTPVTAGSPRMWSPTTISPLNLIRLSTQFPWPLFYVQV